MFHGRWPNGWGVVEVVRWFESNFEAPARFSDNAAHIRFARRFGGEEAPTAAAANTPEPPNFVVPNHDVAEIDVAEILDGPIPVLGYLDKPIDSEDLCGCADLVDGHAPFGMKGLDVVFGADTGPLGGLPTGSPADMLGTPPVI